MSDLRPVQRDGFVRAATRGLCGGLMLVFLGAVGCGGPSESSAPVDQAAQSMEELKQAEEKAAALFASLKRTDPLPPQQLGGFLPEAPDGWQAEEKVFTGDGRGEGRFTEASRFYHNADASRTATVRIRDTGGYALCWADMQVDIEPDKNDPKRGLYSKTTQFDGFFSRELGYSKPKGSVVVVLVNRFGVRIEVFGLDAGEAKQIFWKPINTADLAKLGAQ
jgi:hypothetical protein